MSFLVPSLVQPDLETPPRDKVTIFGDGNTKGIYVDQIVNCNCSLQPLTFVDLLLCYLASLQVSL